MTRKNEDLQNKKKKVKAEKVKNEKKEKKDPVKSVEEVQNKFKDKTSGFEKRIRFKNSRVCAVLLDILIVGVFCSLLASNTITNPFYGMENEAQKDFHAAYSAATSELKERDTLDNDDVIYLYKAIAPSYRIYSIRTYFANYFWYIVLVVLYFGVFAYFNNGQTLFKKMYNLRVVDNKTGKKANLFQMIRRNMFGGLSLLMGNNFVLALNVLNMVFVKNAFAYTVISFSLVALGFVIDIVFLLLFFFKKNGRSLDDLVGNTKVIEVPKKNVLNEN